MRRALLFITCLFTATVLSLATPAGAQVTAPPQLGSAGTWVGQIVAHDRHLDYVGSPCPVEAEVCAAFIARYLIVPTTSQAYFALQSAAGGTAVLRARLLPTGFGEHHGVLFVSQVL